MRVKPWAYIALFLAITILLTNPAIAAISILEIRSRCSSSCGTYDCNAMSYTRESRNSEKSEGSKCINWIGDKNGNKIDDFIESQTGTFDIFVHYDREPEQADLTILSNYGRISGVYESIGIVAVRSVLKAYVEAIAKLKDVIMIELQGISKPCLDISVAAIKARQSLEYSPNTAWDLGYMGSGITIAVVDSGVDNDHESFSGKFVAGYNAITDTVEDPDDLGGHGTNVAGIALGAGGPSERDYKGVAPGARLVDVKVINVDNGSEDDIVRGIHWVTNNHVAFDIRIMCISIAIMQNETHEKPSDGKDSVSQAVNEAVDAGIVVVAAVGNSGQHIIPAPAAADKAIAVGAISDIGTVTRDDDTIWDDSNFGPRLSDGDSDQIDELKPDIVAPGVQITGPWVNTTNQYDSYTGTSQATPHIAGVVALMLEKEPGLTPTQVKDILRRTADDRNGVFDPALDPKYDVKYGWGIVDAYEAVELSLLSWERTLVSTHFSVSYNVTGPNTTNDTYALTVIYALEKSWMTLVVDLGFSSPPELHIPVYLEDLPFPILGKTSSNHNPTTGWHIEFIKIDIELEQGLARTTAAHEFFHTVQLSYDPEEADWISEGTAKWAESRVYPAYTGSSSYVEYVNLYMNNPDRSLSKLGYEAVLFWIFIDQHYGVSTFKSILQQTITRNGINAVDAALNAIGTSFVNVFKEWTIANYFKDIYYSNGQLFNPISFTEFSYSGGRIDFGKDVIDWGADYYAVTSSVIYMPMQFVGGQHHNLTKILIEHGALLISDFVLFIPYAGSYWLMQANNLDKIVIIVRSLGTETSNDRTTYTLTWLSSSQTLQGPYTITSAQTNLYARSDKGIQNSPSITAYTIGSSSSQISPQINPTVVADSSYRSSSTKQVYTINGSSEQNSAPLPLYALNDTSSQDSFTKPTTVVSNSSIINSSPTPIEVEPIPPTASFVYRPPFPVVNQTVAFDATSSTPNGGTIVTYQWDFGDSSFAEGETLTHVFTFAGNYTVTLNVTDSEGAWNTTFKSVMISESGSISVRVRDLVTTDEDLNAKTIFAKGQIVQFNFIVENTGNIDLKRGLISVVVLNSRNATVFLSYTFEDVDSGNMGEFAVGYLLPSDLASGNYTVKIIVWTDWPSHHGAGLAINSTTFEVMP
jgi:subtilisin family serine protease/PKD repeat protein